MVSTNGVYHMNKGELYFVGAGPRREYDVTGRVHELLAAHSPEGMVSISWGDLQYINECAEADEIRHRRDHEKVMAQIDELRVLLGLEKQK
jgi:hypothetical protein